jgi:hypothetical protein
MRNIFDQYIQPENKLTHALATALHQDKNLLSEFLTHFLKLTHAQSQSIKISVQKIPSAENIDSENDNPGIPDIWFYNDDRWCTVVECKINSPLHKNQLDRHIATAKKYGFETILTATITKSATEVVMLGAIQLEWKSIYAWLKTKYNTSQWANHAAAYFEILEVQMIQQEQLVSGSLTTFSGFQSARTADYSYPEAKRLLGLVMAKLRENQELQKEIGMSPDLSGRKAITGSTVEVIWDYLQLSHANSSSAPTDNIHLTLGIQRGRIQPMITIPNSINTAVRNNFKSLSHAGFTVVLKACFIGMQKIMNKEPSAIPLLRMVQRRYPSQRSEPFMDADLTVDLRTAFDGGDPVKHQPEWIEAAYGSFVRKNSNLQMQVGMHFPLDCCMAMDDENATELVAAAWLACKPLIDIAYPAKA